MKTFFTADLHHAHASICEKAGRPYGSLEEMHDAMRADWNMRVSPQDRVFVIGDVSFAKKLGGDAWLRSLNGQKFLVAGNHDFSDGMESSKHWAWVKDLAEIRMGSDWIVMCHFPLLSWHRQHKGSFMLHGHCHGNMKYPWRMRRARILDVGVDATVKWLGHYGPVEWDEIREHMASRGIVSLDHHQAPSRLAKWWREFKCWVKTGHTWDKTGSSRMASREMNTCQACGKYEAGPD